MSDASREAGRAAFITSVEAKAPGGSTVPIRWRDDAIIVEGASEVRVNIRPLRLGDDKGAVEAVANDLVATYGGKQSDASARAYATVALRALDRYLAGDADEPEDG